MDAHMIAEQMDPAPSSKAASDEPEKVWDSKSSAFVEPGQNVEKHSAEISGEPQEAPVTEEDLVVAVPKVHTPAAFFKREAYVALNDLGLTELPEGCFKLAYHSVSHQWHGRWDAENRNYAPSWGPSIRSETKALVLALIQLWEWKLQTAPESSEVQDQLKRLETYSSTLEFWYRIEVPPNSNIHTSPAL